MAWFSCDPLLGLPTPCPQGVSPPIPGTYEAIFGKGTLGVVLREAVLCQEKTEETEVMASVLGTVWAMRVCVSPFLKL